MVIQNECYRVVTISYLKSIIKDGSTYLIQNSSGGGVDVNLNALPTEKRRDDYCPTFKELTKGDLIPNWKAGTTPNGDTDGISITIPPILGGTKYTDDQLVDQNDLLVKYTRFSGLTISASKTSMSECGDNATISFEHKYIRRTKAMDGCPTDRPITYKTTSAATSDTVCSELTWHTDYGSVTNCTTYTIGKNGSVSANSRTDNVYATVNFRGEQRSNPLKMNQAALTGSYSSEKSGSYEKVRTGLSCTPTPSGLKVYGTNSDETCTVYSAVSLAGTGTYDEYKTYYWIDSCGQVYTNLTERRKITAGATETLTPATYTFNYSTGCCDTSSTTTKDLTLTYGSSSCTKTFSAICESCTCTQCECSVTVTECIPSDAHGTDRKKIIALYKSHDCDGSWSWQHISGPEIVYDLTFSGGYIKAANYPNPSYTQRSEVIECSIGDCSTKVTICQESATPPPSCKEIIVDGLRETMAKSGDSANDSSLIADGARFIIKVWEDDNIPEDILLSKEWTWDWMNKQLDPETRTATITTYPTDYPASTYPKNTATTVGENSVLTVQHNYVGGTPAGLSFWPSTQCVVARLEYLAHRTSEDDHYPTCLQHNCSYGCYPSNSRSKSACTAQEEAVGSLKCCSSTGDCAGGIDYWYGGADYGNNGNDPLLSYAQYNLKAYTGNKDRLVTVHWFRYGDDWDACPSSLIALLQKS